ncbi:MAG TPA: protease inhibitor I42 family protein [Polyangiaceae bacterium]|nr:protease inhibitor I42 family protein [Polyangiaceae bacterium]
MPDLDQSADGATITLSVGESRSLVLGERPTTGFRWHVAVSNRELLEVADTFRPRSLKPGGGGERVFTISALKRGASTVTWSHQRGTSEATADRSITVTFQIT